MSDRSCTLFVFFFCKATRFSRAESRARQYRHEINPPDLPRTNLALYLSGISPCCFVAILRPRLNVIVTKGSVLAHGRERRLVREILASFQQCFAPSRLCVLLLSPIMFRHHVTAYCFLKLSFSGVLVFASKRRHGRACSQLAHQCLKSKMQMDGEFGRSQCLPC